MLNIYSIFKWHMDKYTKIDEKVEGIVKKVSLYMRNLNFEYIKSEIFRAYLYSRDAHEGQNRLSGDPYIIHPVEATEILLELNPDIYTIQACLLHDVIEDTLKTSDDIKKEFGVEVAFLCEGLAKLSKIRYKGEDRDVGSLRKMVVAMAEDLRVIFVKLSDRLHNMRTLRHHPKKEKREKIALETLNIFSPIADRLGLYHMKNSLDEECFKILDIDSYRKLKRELKELEPQRKAFVKNVKEEITILLSENGLQNFEVDYRVKSIYSIHKKLLKKGLTNANELFDLFGIRIMVDNESDCYRVLGIIHNTWTPLPKRFKDYIALPKPNGYRSLHTSIMGLFKADRRQATEIQIKTFKMREYSDLGVAAHFEYKEKGSSIATDIDWVKELKELVNNVQDSDFVGSLKVDFFKDRIYVFTPKGDHINLPSGSTPIDFAYAVHTELGNHISIAKVNDSVYPLDKELHNGDVVEIVIDKNKRPNPFRISFVKTIKAKNRIKATLKKEDQELHRERGKDIMSKYLEKVGLGKIDKDLTILKTLDGKNLNMEERLLLLEQIGDFSMPPASLIKKIVKSSVLSVREKYAIDNNLVDSNKNEGKSDLIENQEVKNIKTNLIIGGESGLDYKLCYCSRRKITNDIVAHINNKGQFTIHRRNCKVLDDVNKDRLLPAYIDGEKPESIIINIILIVKNQIGVLKEISDIIYNMGINIDSINTKKIGNLQTEISLGLSVIDYDYLIIDRFVDRVKAHLKETLLSSEMGKIGK
ncbi:MAG: RelA/SpoT family protein [Candidatus Gracilibacteria bacterium]|nr:RelA/SpoT family protein [Candidatus Gracilibacteria bacterium]